MNQLRRLLASTCLLVALSPAWSAGFDEAVKPLVIGETLTIKSQAVGESRRINVYLPAGYAQAPKERWPVLYMPDGGLAEDFLHVAGLLQVSAANLTMRPFILVGIENTERRRDLTGPTEQASDRKIAPRVGGSAAFRQFIREELMPAVQARYRTTQERAIIGESLAGLFVVETWVLEPALFDTYIALDPSLWWNKEGLIATAAQTLKTRPASVKPALLVASSSEPTILEPARRFAELLTQAKAAHWKLLPLPDETHMTVYHPAALIAVRQLFKPAKP
ncbi:alpha/beta hydrolase [Paucibacter sp. JuS9]|uniref:alpha/beta hydrolase n=1 Tax=Roseateles TaxID=93681 RepID=UPI002FE66FFE